MKKLFLLLILSSIITLVSAQTTQQLKVYDDC